MGEYNRADGKGLMFETSALKLFDSGQFTLLTQLTILNYTEIWSGYICPFGKMTLVTYWLFDSFMG